MEHIGINQNMIYNTIHSKNHICKSYFSFQNKVDDVSTDFKKYGMLWKKDYIEFFVNDISFGKINNTK